VEGCRTETPGKGGEKDLRAEGSNYGESKGGAQRGRMQARIFSFLLARYPEFNRIQFKFKEPLMQNLYLFGVFHLSCVGNEMGGKSI
jgi:hypothetical protein